MSKSKDQLKLEHRVPVLDEIKKLEMMAVLIRNQKAFIQVKETLKLMHIRFIGDGMSLVWKLVNEFYDCYSELPSKGSLVATLHEEVQSDETLITKDEKSKIDEFIEYAYDDENEHGTNIAISDIHCKVAVKTARRWINEVKARILTENLIRDGTVPEDMIEELGRSKIELEIASALTDIEIGVAYPDGWDSRGDVQLFTTGCDVLDDFFGGGWRGKEIILFMGPYSSCKTSLVCHCVANLVKHAQKIHKQSLSHWNKNKTKSKPKKPMVVLIFTESDSDEYRCRIMSNMAQVPWKKLATMKNLKYLSSSTKPGTEKSSIGKIGTEYEKYEFPLSVQSGEGFKSERQRVQDAAIMANEYLLLIDATASEDSAYRIGHGGIPELANILQAHFRVHKDQKPLCIWIDHISAMADRMCMTGNSNDDEGRRETLILKRIPLEVADRLAKPWKVPVALMHQFSGKTTGRGVTARYHHSDAEGSKSVGKYVNFAVCTGPTNEEGMCVWDVTKHRREPPVPRKVVSIQGAFQRIRDRSDTHHVPAGSTTILPRTQMEKLEDKNKKYGSIPGVNEGDIKSAGL